MMHRRDLRIFEIYLMLIFCSITAQFFPILSYFDEATLCIGILLYVIDCIRLKKVNSFEVKFIILIGLIYLIGFISNLESPFKIQIYSLGLDCVQTLKPYMFFLIIYHFSTRSTISVVSKYMEKIIKSLLIIFTFLAISSQFFSIGMSEGERYGIKSFKFTYSFSGDLGFLIILFFLIIFNSKYKNKLVYLLLSSFILIFTTKFQVIDFLILFVLFNLAEKSSKIRVITSPTAVLAGVIILWLVGKQQIYDYFLNQYHYSPRRIFFESAIDTSREYFPLGLGFGSYGSDAAAKFYSPVYNYLGFNGLYGLNPGGGALNDNYFASILGQFGWLGLLILVFIFLIIINRCISKLSGSIRASCFSVISVFFIASFGSGTVRSAVGMTLFGFLGILLASNDRGSFKGAY